MNRSRRQFLRVFGSAITAGTVVPSFLMDLLKIPRGHIVVPGPMISRSVELPFTPDQDGFLVACQRSWAKLSASPLRPGSPIAVNLDTYNWIRKEIAAKEFLNV